MESKLKHLEFIQSAILRFSNNSFLLKGWNITISSALFALSSKEANKGFILLAYCVSLIFWILDAYYLSLERKYRILYNEVRNKNKDEVDFSLDITGIFIKSARIWYCLFSLTNILFYLIAAILVGFVWWRFVN